MRCYERFFILTGLLCVGLLVFTSWHATNDDNASEQFHKLYWRLLKAEQHGEELSYKLIRMLEKLKGLNNTRANLTFSNSSRNALGNSSARHFFQLDALLYLPHLRQSDDSLQPRVHLGQGRSGVSLVLGIPTVRREKQSYLVNTVSSLIFDLTPEQKTDIVIVIFIAEINNTFVKSIAKSIQENFPDDVKSGLVEVISPSPFYYPNLSNLKETFGDSRERVKWRTKQNLDYSYLMLYAQHKGRYYIQLEDDIVAKSGYSDIIKERISNVDTEQWLFLEFSQLGFIGKLFRTSELPSIVEFFLMFHKDKPIDWLLDHILWVKMCNPEKDSKHCNGEKAKLKRTFKPSLFQHVGVHSSLPGKIQNLKDKDFGKQVLYKAHQNPPAMLNSSLTYYQSHSLDRAYRGEDFLWAFTPNIGDYIFIMFNTPQTVKRYRFRSGNIEANGDRFYNTTVEVLPSDVSVRKRAEQGLLPCCKPSSGGFIVIGSFVNGIAEGPIDEALHDLEGMRLIVHSTSDAWVVLSEIFIEVDEL
ncbi:alpha-1,3-mannosyl-glycoprotein 4-beta-N-acetylglucosaminyltransferase B-like [Ictalurus punctatus]|uniref:Alpha-1,3-mannosyl-glycoprotein 4-beta-N-acetylglucosaminyltransferase B-like n=1 Tax=Ictalurus punctatus TaxID=7998 RepID=A0A2D0RJG7_ICTPU|nr:alpha-1,3-mannosyl-glycoprotein 4-beta-N-acetylglucosaminyltransferase B-like [Ictalurus punctatus]